MSSRRWHWSGNQSAEGRTIAVRTNQRNPWRAHHQTPYQPTERDDKQKDAAGQTARSSQANHVIAGRVASRRADKQTALQAGPGETQAQDAERDQRVVTEPMAEHLWPDMVRPIATY